MSWHDSRDPGQLQILFRELYQTWNPADEHERNLVDTMVLSIWRRTRILGMEAAGISLQMRTQTIPACNGHTAGFLAVTTLAQENRALELLHRYETRYARAYERAARSLIAYRKYRQAESAQIPEPQDTAPESAPVAAPTNATQAPTQFKNLPNKPKPATDHRSARRLKRWQKRHGDQQSGPNRGQN